MSSSLSVAVWTRCYDGVCRPHRYGETWRVTQALIKAFAESEAGARAGAIVTIKVLIRHRMESGHRPDRVGAVIPRNIIHSFSAHYDGDEVFRMELFPGIAANPYLEFKIVATRSADMLCRWRDDAGREYEQSVAITVR